LANFTAIDNNFTNVSNSISAINTKLTDIDFINVSNGTTTIQNDLKIIAGNNSIFVDIIPIVTGTTSVDTGMTLIRGRASASTIIRAGANGLESNKTYNEGLLFSSNSNNEQPQMSLDLNGNLLIGTNRNKMLHSTIYKLNVDGNANIIGDIICNSITTNSIILPLKRAVYTFEGNITLSSNGNLEYRTYLIEAPLTLTTRPLGSIFIESGKCYSITGQIRIKEVLDVRVNQFTIYLYSGTTVIYTSQIYYYKNTTSALADSIMVNMPEITIMNSDYSNTLKCVVDNTTFIKNTNGVTTTVNAKINVIELT
jgi:hypothetical protein